MTEKTGERGDDFLRKAPMQRRSQATIGFIAEAATAVLRNGGEDAVTTTAVAERAGVSIGTVYQYFADRDALLRAAAERERMLNLAQLRWLLSQADMPGGGRVRAFVRALIASMRGRAGARRQFTLLAVAAIAPGGSWRRDQFADTLAEHWHRRHPAVGADIDRIEAYVLTHAIAGALHAATAARPELLGEPAFEDALLRLARAFWPRNRDGAAPDLAATSADTPNG